MGPPFLAHELQKLGWQVILVFSPNYITTYIFPVICISYRPETQKISLIEEADIHIGKIISIRNLFIQNESLYWGEKNGKIYKQIHNNRS